MRLLSVDARVTGRDRGALAALIDSHHPDVACVHNGPSLLRWRSISAALGRRSGLVVVTGGRSGGANLIMSTLGVDVVTSADVRFPGRPALHPAGAALAVLRLRGHEFAVGAVAPRGSGQAEEFERALAGLVPGDPPAVVCIAGGGAPAGRIVVVDGVQADPRITVTATERDAGATILELTLP